MSSGTKTLNISCLDGLIKNIINYENDLKILKKTIKEHCINVENFDKKEVNLKKSFVYIL